MKLQSKTYPGFWLLVFGLLASLPVWATVPVADSLAPMLERVSPAVVNIRADIKITDINVLRELQARKGNNNFDPDSAMLASVASGVIVDAKQGYILTNSHVVADAQTITVTLSDGRHYTAKTLGMDKPSDIALLQIKAKNLASMVMGNSSLLKVGDFVTAIGNPFGLQQTVTSGIVSALGRTTLGIENYEDFIQTDASINPGNSGGALINMKGELVGINTAILAPARGNIGIGFAIPINMAKSVMLQLIQFGNVKRGVLGIGAQDITPELAGAFNITRKGAVITQVLPQSPALLSGLQVGDIITAINGNEIKSASDVVNTIGFLRVDTSARVTVLRNGKSLIAAVSLSDPKKRQDRVAQTDPFLYGVGLTDFNQYSPIHGSVKGVLVASVERDSTSWHSDLRPGDVITSVNGLTIANITELRAATAKASKDLLLHVLRGQGAFFLVINKEY